MKNLPNKLLIISISAFLLLMGWPSSLLSAADPDVSIIARNSGSRAVLEVSAVQGQLFNLTDIVPGDEETAYLTIDNQSSRSLTFYLRAERKTSEIPVQSSEDQQESGDNAEKPDLLTELRLKVEHDESMLYPESESDLESAVYSGFVDDFASQNVLLGTVPPGENSTLAATVYLPSGIGNDYAELSAEVNWILVARGSSSGGGSSGGSSGGGNSQGQDEEEDEETEEEIIIPEEDDVFAPPEEPEESIDVPQTDAPKMPATGVGSPLPYYAAGTAAVIGGFLLVKRKE